MQPVQSAAAATTSASASLLLPLLLLDLECVSMSNTQPNFFPVIEVKLDEAKGWPHGFGGPLPGVSL